jgi:hypothetical protein
MRGAGVSDAGAPAPTSFEPAHALGNRVLSPASLAELEHPRIREVEEGAE